MKYQARHFLPFVLVALVVAIFSIAYSVSLAQESPVPTPTAVVVEPPAPPDLPDEPPDQATGLLSDVQKWLLFVAGLIATHVMAGVKKLPWFGKQDWFLKLVTELVSGVSASVVAFLLGNAAIALGFLDESGLWQVVIYAWPAAVGIYHGKKFSKAKVLQATAQ